MTDRQKPRTLSDDDAPDFLDGAPRFFQQYFWDALHHGKRTGRQAIDEFFGQDRIFGDDEDEARDALGRYTDEAYKACLEGRPVPRRGSS